MDGIASAKAKNVCIMDADLQHPPSTVPELNKALKQKNVDIAIGSRYVRGSSLKNWGLSRKIISSAATKMSRTLIPRIRHVKDPLSGFFMVRKSIISDEIHPSGYKILLEILARCEYGGVVEIPYAFSGRASGGSKLGATQILKFLGQLKNLAGKSRGADKGE